MDTLEFHPLANLFPLIEGEEFDALAGDIRDNGLHEPIDLYQGKILDGRNRYRAALAAGIELEKRNFRHYHPELYGDPLAYVISKNLNRRHLDDRQRASVAAKIANFTHGGNRSNPPIGGLTVDQAAEKLNVSPRQVERARTVHDHGVPEVRDALDRGEIAVSAAERIARLPQKEQVEVIRRHLPNGSRAIMGSRVEPDDSLDYFPTPPWATRALIEVVLRQTGHAASVHAQTVWEPACGEGHMAEVLAEYFGDVVASDIHDYGYGHTANFLGDIVPSTDDWIITNPPFGKDAEAFVLRALEFARVGVAMFLRLQWLETNGRFERVFLPHPPALIAQFAERVPLHKGRWEPDGDTATAYLWIVWLKLRAGRDTRFMWIPPGQREALTKPDDAERFTAHPVIRRSPRPAAPVTAPADAQAQCQPETESQSEPQALPDNEHGGPPGAVEPAHVSSVPSPAGAGSPSQDDIDLTLPDFLDRRVPAQAEAVE
jgi:hypothetical protein